MKCKWYLWTRPAVLLLVLSGPFTSPPVLGSGGRALQAPCATRRRWSGATVTSATRRPARSAQPCRAATGLPVGTLSRRSTRCAWPPGVRSDGVHGPAVAPRPGAHHRPRAAAAGRDRKRDGLGRASLLDMSSARIGTNVVEREVRTCRSTAVRCRSCTCRRPGSVNSGTGTFGDIRFSGRAVQQNIIRYDGIEGSAIIDASPGN